MRHKGPSDCSTMARRWMVSSAEQQEVLCHRNGSEFIVDIAEAMKRSQTVFRNFLADVNGYGVKKHLGRLKK